MIYTWYWLSVLKNKPLTGGKRKEWPPLQIRLQYEIICPYLTKKHLRLVEVFLLKLGIFLNSKFYNIYLPTLIMKWHNN